MAKYENWIPIFSSGTDYEADIVRDRLDDSGIPAVVLTQRDHAFNLNVSDLAEVNVLVPPDHAEAAREILEEKLTDAELEEAALAADPNAPDAHTPDDEARLDSGYDRTDLSVPDEDDDNDDA
mgnify:CR=1 FL=1